MESMEKNKVALVVLLIFIMFCPIIILVDEDKAKANIELKYDMTYGITINPLETKEKVLTLKKGINSVKVIPDSDGRRISCIFLDSNKEKLKDDNNVTVCNIRLNKKKLNTVTVKIENPSSQIISVELKHIVK